MGFIPRGARWYLADIVLEHQIEGDPRNVVHTNTHLIEAASPEEAYEKALALGRDCEQIYENTDHREVRVVFRGLRALDVIHDDLEDGAEILYTEEVGVPEERLRAWLVEKAQLSVFAPIEAQPDRPNYMPLSVAQRLDEILGNDSGTDEPPTQPP